MSFAAGAEMPPSRVFYACMQGCQEVASQAEDCSSAFQQWEKAHLLVWAWWWLCLMRQGSKG